MQRKPTPDMFAANDDTRIDMVALAVGPAKRLALALIRIDGGTQPRAEIDRDVVSDYAEAIRNGAEFPAAVVYFDGTSYWLADGFHRYHAHKQAGLDDIRVDLRQGNLREAILYSFGANAHHGLRRSNEDKRRAVLRLLEDPEWEQWSDREIARRTGTTHPFVSSLRPVVTGNVSSDNRQFTSKHGTTGTMTSTSAKPWTVPKTWTTLTWAVYDWSNARLPDSRRLYELKELGITRNKHPRWERLAAFVEEQGVRRASTSEIVNAVAVVRGALQNDTVPVRSQPEPEPGSGTGAKPQADVQPDPAPAGSVPVSNGAKPSLLTQVFAPVIVQQQPVQAPVSNANQPTPDNPLSAEERLVTIRNRLADACSMPRTASDDELLTTVEGYIAAAKARQN